MLSKSKTQVPPAIATEPFDRLMARLVEANMGFATHFSDKKV
jgi:hypothetical protein